MRSQTILLTLAAVVIAALALLSIGDRLAVDWLWFGSLGYRSVFTTALVAKVTIFALVWVVAFGAICLSGLIAVRLSKDQEKLHVAHQSEERAAVNLPDLIRARGGQAPWKLLVVGVSAVLAIFVAQSEAGNWTTYLKGIYGRPFGLAEEAFGNDVGFYVFSLPLLEDFLDLFLLLIFLAGALAAGVYWLRGTLDFRASASQISSSAGGHLTVLLGLFFLQLAAGYWLDRFELLFHTNGVVHGLRYVDHLLWQPGLWVLVMLSIAAAALCFYNLRERGFRYPIIAAVGVFGVALLMNVAQAVIERFWVKPDELRIEQPYLERNIAMTRKAYKLDGIEVQPFATGAGITKASLTANAVTIDNIRLWDPRPLLATYRQLQEIRLYYDFTNIDIDRYQIDGRYTEVMLSARELNTQKLPSNAQTWVNRYLKFTHGSGVAMSPVNSKNPDGMPVFYVKDIPPVSDVGINVSQPGLYFGEQTEDYCIVKSATPEFDYPKKSDNVYGFYEGSGGTPVTGLWRRMIFGYFFGDVNILVTENIKAGSRIMIRRNIIDRITTVAPFLILDRDPYVVIHNGHLVWMVDAYTTSDRFPYSQPTSNLSYIRNSVKVVVDAYSGKTDFYVADASDPIIQTWEHIFPALFKPISAMPSDLRAHVRYPLDFFLIQSDLYRTYHMTDPQVFYNREDLWSFPRENYDGNMVVMQPYYVIMRLPNEDHAEYVLMLPMVPKGRDNMIAWLAARSDGKDYGHLFEYSFSKERLFYGPYQIEARINQNPKISQQLSLWNQMGSKVLLGNLLVIPVHDELLYVEPLYLRAESGELPQLQRVLAAYRDHTVMADTLDSALGLLFGTNVQAAASVLSDSVKVTSKAPAPGAAASAARAQLPGLEQASIHYNQAIVALKAGNWARFGEHMNALGRELNRHAGSSSK